MKRGRSRGKKASIQIKINEIASATCQLVQKIKFSKQSSAIISLIVLLYYDLTSLIVLLEFIEFKRFRLNITSLL